MELSFQRRSIKSKEWPRPSSSHKISFSSNFATYGLVIFKFCCTFVFIQFFEINIHCAFLLNMYTLLLQIICRQRACRCTACLICLHPRRLCRILPRRPTTPTTSITHPLLSQRPSLHLPVITTASVSMTSRTTTFYRRLTRL